jgi:hypothetical protein
VQILTGTTFCKGIVMEYVIQKNDLGEYRIGYYTGVKNLFSVIRDGDQGPCDPIKSLKRAKEIVEEIKAYDKAMSKRNTWNDIETIGL